MSQKAERQTGTPGTERPKFVRWKFSRPGRIISSLITIALVSAARSAIHHLGGHRPNIVLNLGAAVLVNFVADGFEYH